MKRIVVAAWLALLVGACQTTPSTTDAAPAAAPAPAAAAPAAGTQPVASAEKGDEMVCRNYPVTGSRVMKTRVCKTREEWDESARMAQEALRGTQRSNSTGIGGGG